MNRVKKWLQEASTFTVMTLAIALVLAIGIADFVTGPQLAFTVFYLAPIAVAEWRFGLSAGTLVAVIAANTWLATDLVDRSYDNVFIPLWNTTSRFVLFMIVLRLLANLRVALGRQTHLARLDPLTGLLNARAFTDASKRAVEQAQRDQVPFTFVYLDLDDFKAINDKLGHAGGDKALRTVAEQLWASVRATDLVGRLGGDEFALLFPNTGSAAAKVVLTNLLDRVSRGLTRLPIEVTFSAGAATFLVEPDSLDDVIKATDALMFEAKRQGKNRHIHIVVGAHSPSAVADQSPSREPLRLEGTTHMQTALEPSLD